MKMKQITLIMVFLFLNICSAQNFDTTLPKSYKKILEVKGDLDKDGIDEIVYVYNTDKEVEDLGFERELYICKIKNGIIKLWKQNKSILWKSNDCGFFSEDGVQMSLKIVNNTLILKQTFNSNTRNSQTYKNIFRFQNNDWFLIGSNCSFDAICYSTTHYDINFSINKVIVSEEFHNCNDEAIPKKNYYETFTYNFSEIPKMDGFIAGKTEIEIPNTEKYFQY